MYVRWSAARSRFPTRLMNHARALRLTEPLVEALDVPIDKRAPIVVDLVLDGVHGP